MLHNPGALVRRQVLQLVPRLQPWERIALEALPQLLNYGGGAANSLPAMLGLQVYFATRRSALIFQKPWKKL